jgi:hypothetical protein
VVALLEELMNLLIQVCLFYIFLKYRLLNFQNLYKNTEPYNIGRKTQDKCEYEFRSSVTESGVFMSPTYPGTYPNILNCSYKFIGQPNERVEIYFEEILLHYGADQ